MWQEFIKMMYPNMVESDRLDFEDGRHMWQNSITM